MSELIVNYFFFGLTSVVTMALLYASFMPRRIPGRPWMTAAALLPMAGVYLLLSNWTNLVEQDVLRLTVNLLAMAVALFLVQLLYSGRVYQKLLVGVFYLGIIVLAEQVFSFFLMVDWSGTGAYAVNYIETGNYVSLFALAFGVILRLSRRKTGIHISRRVSVMQVAIAAICILCIAIISVDVLVRGSLSLMEIVLGLGFLAVLILFYLNFEMTDSVVKRNQEYALQQQRHELLEGYYKQVEAHQNEVREIRHDMKNQLISLAGHIESGSPEKAARQIDDLISQLSAGDDLRFTAHSGINALLGSKYRQAQAEDIVCDFTVKLPADISIGDNDLAALVGNVLDNAIEACRYCTGQRYIQFKLVCHGDTLVISSENSTDGHTDTATRKGDTLNHGRGLSSMRRTVEQYGGDMQYRFSPGSFSLELTLFAPKA